MPWREAGPVSEEPCIALVRWRVMHAGHLGTRFVGFRAESGTGRVSSAIVELDTAGYRGVTLSGRVYELAGPAGASDEVAPVWLTWVMHEHLVAWADVTEQLFPDATNKRYQ